MTYQETHDKLRAMHLQGMAEGIEIQSKDTSFSTLAFEDRLQLLVDRE